MSKSNLLVMSMGLASLETVGVISPGAENRLSSSSSSSCSWFGLGGCTKVLGTILLLSDLGLREFLCELQAVIKDLSRLLFFRPSNTFLYISILLWVVSSLDDSASSEKVPATVEQRSGVNSPMEPVDLVVVLPS